MDGLTTILGDGMETTQMNGFGDGLMDEWRPIVFLETQFVRATKHEFSSSILSAVCTGTS